MKKYKQLPEEVSARFEMLLVGAIAIALVFFGIFK